MVVKSLAGLESLKKKPIFDNARLINLSLMQVFWIQAPKICIN